MGGEKDGYPLFPAEIMNDIEHPIRSIGVEPDRGLVEKDEFRLLHKDLGNAQALSHPFRIHADLLFGLVQEADRFEGIIDSGPRSLSGMRFSLATKRRFCLASISS